MRKNIHNICSSPTLSNIYDIRSRLTVNPVVQTGVENKRLTEIRVGKGCGGGLKQISTSTALFLHLYLHITCNIIRLHIRPDTYSGFFAIPVIPKATERYI